MNKKKLIRIGSISAPIIIAGSSLGIFFAIKQGESKPVSDNGLNRIKLREEEQNPQGNIKIFPELSSYDFYEFLSVKNGEANFTDEFIAKVIGKVVIDMKYTTGHVHWNVEKVDRDNLIFTFVWKPNLIDQTSIWKTYSFKLFK